MEAALGARAVVERGGFDMPTEVRACTERFWRAVDPFESFVSDKLVLQPDATLPGPTVFAVYKTYCTENGSHAVGRNRFYEKLAGLPGVDRDTTTDKNRPFVGVRLAQTAALVLVDENEEIA